MIEGGDTLLNELEQSIGPPLNYAPPEIPRHEPILGRWCRLEPMSAPAHAGALFDEYAAAPDISDWTYLPYGPFPSSTHLSEWVNRKSGYPDPHFFANMNLRTAAAEGVASYLSVNRMCGSIEIGHIHFSRAMQRTPRTTEAIFLLMKREFDDGYRRLEWKCDTLNAPSRAAAARFGFRYEGTFRKAMHYKERSRDTAWFAIADDEWPRLRVEFERWLDPTNFDAEQRQLSLLNCRA